jgi:hypothetical protein
MALALAALEERTAFRMATGEAEVAAVYFMARLSPGMEALQV